MSVPVVNKNQGLVDAALEIAERRANTLRQLKAALLSNDDELALSLARKVCGLDEKNNRANQSLYGIPGGKR
jgi:hypothetical protein